MKGILLVNVETLRVSWYNVAALSLIVMTTLEMTWEYWRRFKHTGLSVLVSGLLNPTKYTFNDWLKPPILIRDYYLWYIQFTKYKNAVQIWYLYLYLLSVSIVNSFFLKLKVETSGASLLSSSNHQLYPPVAGSYLPR